MRIDVARSVAITFAVLASSASICDAQTIEWGVKAGINTSSVKDASEYYDWVLCCHPQFPEAMIEPSSERGVTAGAFVGVPLGRRLAVQAELSFSRRRHSVDLQPYEAIQLTFARDYIEAAGLLKLDLPVRGQNRTYVAAGPVFGFKVGEGFKSSDPAVARGNPETDIYVVQITAYAAPELLKSAQTSVAVAAGWIYRKLLVELRYTQGLQSIFKDRDRLVAGFVSVGGDEATLNRLIPEFGPLLEAGRSRDLAILAGFRF